MEKFLDNYIPWVFDREYSEKQKIRRLKDLEKYILHLFEKMCCILMKFYQWEKTLEKYEKLLYEYRDLVAHLDKNGDDEEALDLLEEKILKIKKRKKYCINCFGEDGYAEFCVCEECENCGRVELCFCN